MTTEGEEETISLEDEFSEALVEDAQWLAVARLHPTKTFNLFTDLL